MDFDIRSQSGEAFSISGQITKPATPGAPPPWPGYPASPTGYTLRFTAKRSKQDATPLVQKDTTGAYVQLSPGGGYTVTILTGDTHAFTATEYLAYDLALIEPDGTATIVGSGSWTVEKSVGL